MSLHRNAALVFILGEGGLKGVSIDKAEGLNTASSSVAASAN
jgi:hypothetical protein